MVYEEPDESELREIEVFEAILFAGRSLIDDWYRSTKEQISKCEPGQIEVNQETLQESLHELLRELE